VYRRRPKGELGGQRAPTFPAPQRLHIATTETTRTSCQSRSWRPAQAAEEGSLDTRSPARARHRKEPEMILQDKVAVIYGAGGAIGGAVARAFAAEGARLFLAGRHRAPVEIVAKDIVSAGGSAEVAEIDALDEQAVDRYLQYLTGMAGRVDISFNAIGLPNPKIRVPLVELDAEAFSLPIATYTRSYFLTARLAARRMVASRSGVIMTVTSTPSRTGTPLVGGGGPAMAAVEALIRGLSAELAPQGIRVVGLRPQGMPETGRIKESFGTYPKPSGMPSQQFH